MHPSQISGVCYTPTPPANANFKKFTIATFHITYQPGTVQNCISYYWMISLEVFKMKVLNITTADGGVGYCTTKFDLQKYAGKDGDRTGEQHR